MEILEKNSLKSHVHYRLDQYDTKRLLGMSYIHFGGVSTLSVFATE